MKFRFSAPSGNNRLDKVQLVGCKAYVDQQHLSVSLPAHATDMRFSREVTMLSTPYLALSNPHIANFLRQLEESVQAGQGALDAPSQMRFNLPAWLLEGKGISHSKAQKEVEAHYVLEKFEQVQNIVFKPSDNLNIKETDDEVKAVLSRLSANSYLAYKETEGGTIHGSSAFLTLRQRRPSLHLHRDAQIDDVLMTDAAPDDGALHAGIATVPDAREKTRNTGSEHVENVRESPSLQMVSSALGIASLLTRASNNNLPAMEISK